VRKRIFVFAGTYTEDIRFGTGAVLRGKGEGVYVYALEPESGRLEPIALNSGVANPSYLCLTRDSRFLYAVNELKSHGGEATGTVSAFAVDPESKKLRLLDRRPTRGTDPCHVALNAAETHVFTSNFGSGSVVAHRRLSDGSLGEETGFVQHRGSGPDPVRQAGPHAHSLAMDPADRHALVPDLGLDRVMIYRFDPGRGRLEPADPPHFQARPGSGPRHLEFHPNGRFAYLANELASSVTAFRYRDGVLEELETRSSLPEAGFPGNTCADLHLAPDGKFLYASNRGHDSLAVFAVDRKSGRLRPVGHPASGGKTPRNFAIAPSGRHLLAANQDSGDIVVFARDPATGGLTGKLGRYAIPTPACLKFAVFEEISALDVIYAIESIVHPLTHL
jgi:6-phosphogluconolactonase